MMNDVRVSRNWPKADFERPKAAQTENRAKSDDFGRFWQILTDFGRFPVQKSPIWAFFGEETDQICQNLSESVKICQIFTDFPSERPKAAAGPKGPHLTAAEGRGTRVPSPH